MDECADYLSLMDCVLYQITEGEARDMGFFYFTLALSLCGLITAPC